MLTNYLFFFRSAFINKRVIEVQQDKLNKSSKLREDMLMKQKREQEELIYSIFPKIVAEDLIQRQSQETVTGYNASTLKALSANTLGVFGRIVARMHQDVTILFTDIVGFTSMSQTCPPYDVMEFLHSLFVEFDNLVDMDDHLWKVETIGDAFMVASGLNVTGEGESISMISPDSSITPGGQGDYLLPQSLSRSHLDEVDEKSSGLDSQSIGAKTLTGKTIIK